MKLLNVILNILMTFLLTQALDIPSRKEQQKTAEALKSLPPRVEKTIRGLNAQGMPKQAILDRIKHVAKDKDVNPERLVESILKKDPKREAKLSANDKKRAAKLKNDIRLQEKKQRKAQLNRNRGEL